MKRFLVLFVLILAAAALLAVSVSAEAGAEQVPEGLYFVDTEWDAAEQREVISQNPNPKAYWEWDYESRVLWSVPLAYYNGISYSLLTDCSMLTYSGPVEQLVMKGSQILLQASGLGRITVTYDGRYSVEIDINYPRYGLYTEPETDASAMISQYDAGTQGDVFYIVARDDAAPIVSVTVNRYPDYYQFQKINDRVWSVTLTDAADGRWGNQFLVNVGNDWWYTDYCYFTRVKPGLYFVNTEWDDAEQRRVVSKNPYPEFYREWEYSFDAWLMTLAYYDGTDYTLLRDCSMLTYSGPAEIWSNNSEICLKQTGLGRIIITYDNRYSVVIDVNYPHYGLYTVPETDASAMFRQYDAGTQGDVFYIVARDDAAPIVSVTANENPDYYQFRKINDRVWSVTLTDAADGRWENQFLVNVGNDWWYTDYCYFTRVKPGLYFVNVDWDDAEQQFVISRNPYPSVYQEWNYNPSAVWDPDLAYYDGTDYTLLRDCSMLTYSGPAEIWSNNSEICLKQTGLGRIIITYDNRYSVELDVNYPMYGLYTEPRVGADVQIQQYDAGLYGDVFYIVARGDAEPIVSVTANGYPDYYQFQKVNDRVWSVTLTDAAGGSWDGSFRVNTANGWWYTDYNSFTRVIPGLYFVDAEWDADRQRYVISKNPNPEKYRQVWLSTDVLWFHLAYYDGNSYTLLTDSSVLTGPADWVMLGDYGDGEIFCSASEIGTATITYQGTDSVELNIIPRPFGLYAEPRADASVLSYDYDTDSRGRVFYIVGQSGQAPITSVRAEWYPSYYEFEKISDLVWSVTLTDEASGNWSDDFFVEIQNGGYWTGYCFFHSGQDQPITGDNWLDNTDGQQINIFVGKDNRRHIIDGIAAEGEYGEELDIRDNYKTFAAPWNVADIVDNPARLWMSTDDEYVYIAAATKADGYHNGCDNNPSNLWGQYGIQISLADTDNNDSSYRLELGYGKSSETGNLLFVNWNDGLGYGYEAVPGEDFQVRVGTDEILYEMRIPFEAFTSKNPEDLHAFRFCIVWATGTSEDDLVNQYEHVQLGYGVTGIPGKDVTGHAVIMIEEAPAVLYGDLNCDGAINIRDVVLLLRNSMFPAEYPIAYQESSDFNGDGSVDVHDAALLLQYSLFPNLYPLA